MSVRKGFRNTPIDIGLLLMVVLFVSVGGIMLFGIRCMMVSGATWRHLQKAEGEYVVGVKTSLEKVFREKNRLTGPITFRASISAAQNEYESFQLILVPKKEDLRNVRIEPTALKCLEKGTNIDRENIFCHRVGYVKTRTPPYDTEFVGWWPDPLFPISVFTISQKDVQPVWVTVYVPEGTPSGCYEGFLFVLPENAETTAVPIHLQVWDFALPVSTKLQVVFSLLEECIQGYYQLEEVPSELLREYYSFLLKHRVNPTSLYLHIKPRLFQPQPKLEDLQFCVDKGLNAVNIAYMYDRKHNRGDKGYFSEEFKRSLEETLPQTVAFFRDHQWQDMAFVYGPDEPVQGDYNGIREIFALVEQTAPGIRRVLTKGPTEKLFGYVDVWVPRIDKYDEKKCRRRQELGEEIWWYVCSRPRHPYPNFFTDYPAIDHRILFWMAWKHNISGFIYYALNQWVSNYPKDHRRWPEVEWNTRTYRRYNGDGQLIYPGPAGEPYGSVRLEVIRDGIEDFEYLRMLQTRLSEAANMEMENKGQFLQSAKDLLGSISKDIVGRRTCYTKDPAELLMYREMVADEIVRISKSVNQGIEFPNVKTEE